MQGLKSSGVLCLLLVSTTQCDASTDAEVVEEPSVDTSTDAVGIGPPDRSLAYFKCATEHGRCAVGAGYAAMGANGSYVYKSVSGSFDCEWSQFGSDPIVGTWKNCYFANYASFAAEKATVSQPAGQSSDIEFGANGAFFYKRVTGNYTCNVATFGDPIVDTLKSCYRPLPSYNPDVLEGGTMTGLRDRTPVAFGAKGKFLYRIVSGSHPCATAAFTTADGGPGIDPAPETPKRCYRAPLVRTTFEGQSMTPPAGAVVLYGSGLNGNFVRAPGTLPSTFTCNNATFGGDPHLGEWKWCWIVV